jgi:membrane protein YdbS with pleckstrin-like domain
MSSMDETAETVTADAGEPAESKHQREPPERQPELYGARRLDPEYIPLQRGVGWILTAIVSGSLLAAIGVLWLTADLQPWARALLIPAWLVLTLGIGWLCYTWPAVHYRHTSYTVDGEGIEIRSGVWWREIVSVPRSRVQHIDVSQGPMERSYGLGRLVLYTAGTAHSRVELQGLSYAVAFALRNHLLPRGSDDAV